MTTPETTVYDLGDPATITLNVVVNGTPTDPDSVTLTVRDPQDVDTQPSVTRTGVGTYQAIITPTLAGDYRYRWVTTGPGAGAEEGAFTVRPAFSGVTAARTRARKRLARMVAADQRPVLDEAALDDLLDTHRVVDQFGNRVTDTGYVPTWDLNVAAAEGWRQKAALVAGDFTFSADDARYDKGQVLANCERMVTMYLAKSSGVLATGARERPYDTSGLFANG